MLRPTVFFNFAVMLIGYARVSTDERNPDLQEDALKAAGCEIIIVDRVSGAKAKRPGLEKLTETLYAYVREISG